MSLVHLELRIFLATAELRILSLDDRNDRLVSGHWSDSLRNLFLTVTLKYLDCQLLKALTFKIFQAITVPRNQSGAVPISSLIGVGSWGSGKLERVGQLGEGWGK